MKSKSITLAKSSLSMVEDKLVLRHSKVPFRAATAKLPLAKVAVTSASGHRAAERSTFWQEPRTLTSPLTQGRQVKVEAVTEELLSVGKVQSKGASDDTSAVVWEARGWVR